MSGVIGRQDADRLAVIARWDEVVQTTTDVRDQLAARIAADTALLEAAERTLASVVASRAEFVGPYQPRELYRREFTPPVAEEDLQLGTDQ